MNTKKYTCVVCPEGCSITVESGDGGEVLSVSGNRCPRGEKYVRSEAVCPVRTITTTVGVRGGSAVVCPVRTAEPVPKAKMQEIMAVLRAMTVPAPVRAGQVLIPDVCGTGVSVVATGSVE